jgi:hypothetical protein
LFFFEAVTRKKNVFFRQLHNRGIEACYDVLASRSLHVFGAPKFDAPKMTTFGNDQRLTMKQL